MSDQYPPYDPGQQARSEEATQVWAPSQPTPDASVQPPISGASASSQASAPHDLGTGQSGYSQPHYSQPSYSQPAYQGSASEPAGQPSAPAASAPSASTYGSSQPSAADNTYGSSQPSAGGFGGAPAPDDSFGTSQSSSGYGAPQQSGYETPQGGGYVADQGGYGSSQPGYGTQQSAPQQAYGAPQQAYGAPQQNYDAPQQNYGAPQQGYDASQQSYAAPQQGGYGAPQGGYGAPQGQPGAMMRPQPTPLQAGADYSADFDPADVAQNKTMAIVGYLGILVLLPMLTAPNSRFAKFHANQSLVNLIMAVGVGIIAGILSLIPVIGGIFIILCIAPTILMIVGMVNASNGQAKTLPFIGNFQLLK